MSRSSYIRAAIAALLSCLLNAYASDDTDFQVLQEQVRQLQQQVAQQSAIPQPAAPARSPVASGEGAFNPAVSMILSGTFEQLQ